MIFSVSSGKEESSGAAKMKGLFNKSSIASGKLGAAAKLKGLR